MRNRLAKAAMALLAALITAALAASTASATRVEPAGDAIKASADDTYFFADNGTGVGITCDSSTATGNIPEDGTMPAAGESFNYNHTDTGDAQGGSVIGGIDSLEFGAPCVIAGTTVEVDVSTTEGFTLSASAEHPPHARHKSGDAAVTVNVPPFGAEISIPVLSCSIDISTILNGDEEVVGVASSVFGTFQNGEEQKEGDATPGRLLIKGQLPFTHDCGINLFSQGVFYATGKERSGPVDSDYEVEDTTDPTQPVIVSSDHL